MASKKGKSLQYLYDFDHDLTLKEFLDYTEWNKSSFYENIEKIFSEDSIYHIPIYKLKKLGRELKPREEYLEGDNDFVFKKEWAGLAIVLVKIYKANPMYKSNSNYKKLTLEKYCEYSNYCLDEVERLPVYQRQVIQQHPIYRCMIVERERLYHIQKTIYGFLRSIIDMPIESRVETLFMLEEYLKNFLIHRWGCQLVTKNIIENNKQEYEGNYYEELTELLYGDYEHEYIDKLIAENLMKEMDKKQEILRENLQNKYLKDSLFSKRSETREEEIANAIINTVYIEKEIEKSQEDAIKKGNLVVPYNLLAKIYIKQNKSVLSPEQCSAIMDFVKTVNSYEEEFDEVFSDEKEVVENVFSATNAKIIKRK